MTPELAKQFREKLGIAADVPEDKLPDLAAQKALSLSADVSTLKTEKDALAKERDTAKADAESKQQQVLQLSGDSKEPDALSLSLISRAFKERESRIVSSGVISDAGVEELRKVFMPGGKPARFSLQLSADSTDPNYLRLLEILEKFPGLKHNNGVARGATVAEPLKLSGDEKEKKPELAEVNRQRAFHHLSPLASLA